MLPSARIKAAAGSSVGCGRFPFPYCCPIWKRKSLQRASFVAVAAAAVSDGEGSLNT